MAKKLTKAKAKKILKDGKIRGKKLTKKQRGFFGARASGKSKKKKTIGRPSVFSKELGNLICERIANGESVLKICKDKEMPCRKTVTNWLLDKNKKDFLRNYEEAVNVRTENMFDEIEDIADNKKGEVQRDRLRIDTRKWYLSKVMPKKYGDKLDLTSDGKRLPTPMMDVTKKNDKK